MSKSLAHRSWPRTPRNKAASNPRVLAAINAVNRSLGGIPAKDRVSVLEVSGHVILQLHRAEIVAKVSFLSEGYTVKDAAKDLHFFNATAPRAIRAPLRNRPRGPFTAGDAIVTLFPFLEGCHPADRRRQMLAYLALPSLYDSIHRLDAGLPSYREEILTVRRALSGEARFDGLSAARRTALVEKLDDAAHYVAQHAHAPRPLHGDLNQGNVILSPAGPVWMDWENACVGPLEWDVAILPKWSHRLFKINGDLLRNCGILRQICFLVWSWNHPVRSRQKHEILAGVEAALRATP